MFQTAVPLHRHDTTTTNVKPQKQTKTWERYRWHNCAGKFGDKLRENATGWSTTVEAVYDLEGKRNNNMSRGVNILRMSDGTTRKVLK